MNFTLNRMNYTTNFTSPEPEVEMEPEREPEPEPELSGFRISPEPEPEFEFARDIWGGAWPAHIYIFAIIFTILVFYNLNSILGLIHGRKRSVRRKKIFLLTNIMLLFFNFISALQLYINPYESHEHFRIYLPGLLFIFFGLRLPCLTGAFSLILITLIETTKVKLYSKQLQNMWYLLGIISIHFIVVVSIHFYLVFHPDEFKLIAICQMFYVLFGTVVSCTVIYSYLKVKQQLIHEPEQKALYSLRSFRFGKGKRRKQKKKDEEIALDETKPEETNEKKDVVVESDTITLIRPRSPFVDRSLSRLFKVATLISISGLLYIIAIFYAFITMIVNADVAMKPWPWLAVQTLSRLAEIGMVVGMSYLVRRNILPCWESERNRSTTVTLSSSK